MTVNDVIEETVMAGGYVLVTPDRQLITGDLVAIITYMQQFALLENLSTEGVKQ